jgi:hypothetical protein
MAKNKFPTKIFIFSLKDGNFPMENGKTPGKAYKKSIFNEEIVEYFRLELENKKKFR